MSTPEQALQIVSLAVDLLQAASTIYGEAGKVSSIIANRIAAGRKEWTKAELDALDAALQEAKSDAHKALDAMAEENQKLGLDY